MTKDLMQKSWFIILAASVVGAFYSTLAILFILTIQ